MKISELPLGRLTISEDREWVAVEQQTRVTNGAPGPPYDVVVRNAMIHQVRATISDCEQLLDVSKNGDVVAVVRDGAVELWDTTTTKRIKRAPFQHAHIYAAKFSPDSSLLALCDQHTLVLWRWEGDQFERMEMGREVASLAFSPDGKRIAEGPAADKAIQIRDIETKKIVQTLSRESISVPQLTFAQGGRVLIACDRQQFKDPAYDGKPLPRIFIWDTLDGSLAHQISAAGPVPEFHLSPNERFLVAQVNGPRVTTLDGWRLDGETMELGGNEPPATQK
jgi:WD40 repeat protein